VLSRESRSWANLDVDSAAILNSTLIDSSASSCRGSLKNLNNLKQFTMLGVGSQWTSGWLVRSPDKGIDGK
jgi:hypothetical protein